MKLVDKYYVMDKASRMFLGKDDKMSCSKPMDENAYCADAEADANAKAAALALAPDSYLVLDVPRYAK